MRAVHSSGEYSMRHHRSASLALAAAATVLLAGCPGSSTYTPASNVKPAFLGAVTKNSYDGVSDDLPAARLGKAGLGAAAAPRPVLPRPAVSRSSDTPS